jgi:hypothetical protein
LTLPSDAVAKLAPEEYRQCLECVEALQKEFPRDHRLLSVLRVHATELTKRLRKLEYVIGSSAQEGGGFL